MADRELLTAIRREIAESPFVGEGHKKLRGRLALRGIHTSGKRVLRLTREAGLLAATPKVRISVRRCSSCTRRLAGHDAFDRLKLTRITDSKRLLSQAAGRQTRARCVGGGARH